MKRFLVFFSVIVMVGISSDLMAGSHDGDTKHKMAMQKGGHEAHDGRISLGNSPETKQHQLANMRSHVEAVQTIVGLLSEAKFEEASKIAHVKLGLTPEMEKMCNMFDNTAFKELGLAFHKSGDKLGEVLKTGELNKSLDALNRTMGYCVQCHETFRQ